MRIEIYENGELISSEDINEIVTPDWGKFNRHILTSNAYNFIINKTENKLAVTHLVGILAPAGYTGGLQPQDYSLVKFLWDSIIAAIAASASPTAEQMAELNSIAINSNVPFSFSENGQLIIE